MQIEEYRTRLEQFHTALNRQIYHHCYGQAGSLDLEGVYSDFSDLYSLETLLEIRSAWATSRSTF